MSLSHDVKHQFPCVWGPLVSLINDTGEVPANVKLQANELQRAKPGEIMSLFINKYLVFLTG